MSAPGGDKKVAAASRSPDPEQGASKNSPDASHMKSPNASLSDTKATELDNEAKEEDANAAQQRYSIMTEVLQQKRMEVEKLQANFRKRGSTISPVPNTSAQTRERAKTASVSPPVRSQPAVGRASKSPASKVSPIRGHSESGSDMATRTSLDREFSPKATDSYAAQCLRERLRDMEKILVKTQSELIREREQGWATKAQLAMEMQGRLKHAESDLKRSKDHLEGRFRELQGLNQETRVALDQEKRKSIALQAKIDVLTASQALSLKPRTGSDSEPEEANGKLNESEDPLTTRSAPPDLNGSYSDTRHIAELVSANATLQLEKAEVEKRVEELESDLKVLVESEMDKEADERHRAAIATGVKEAQLADDNEMLLKAQIQAQQDLQRKDLELRKLSGQLASALHELDAHRDEAQQESLAIHALLGQKTADIARLEDLLRIGTVQRLEGEGERDGLRAALHAEEQRSLRFQDQVGQVAAEGKESAKEMDLLREQVADLQDELTSLHVRMSTQAKQLQGGSKPDADRSEQPQQQERAVPWGVQLDLGADTKVGFTLRLLAADANEEGEEGEEANTGYRDVVKEEVARAGGVLAEQVGVHAVRREGRCTLVDLELHGHGTESRGSVSEPREREHASSAQEALGRVIRQLRERDSVLLAGKTLGQAVAVELYYEQEVYPPYRAGEGSAERRERARRVGGKTQAEWIALVAEQTSQIQAQTARIRSLEEIEKELSHKLTEKTLQSDRVEVGRENIKAELQDTKQELERWQDSFGRLEQQLDQHDSLLKANLVDAERRIQEGKSALAEAERRASEADRRAGEEKRRAAEEEQKTAEAHKQASEEEGRAVEAERRAVEADKRVVEAEKRVSDAQKRVSEAERCASEAGSQERSMALQVQAARERSEHDEGELQGQLARARAVSEQRETALMERLRDLDDEYQQYKAQMAQYVASQQQSFQQASESQREQERAREAHLTDELNKSSEHVHALQQRLADLSLAHETERRRAEELEAHERRVSEQGAAQLELERKDKEAMLRDLRQASTTVEELRAKVKDLEAAEASAIRMREEEVAQARAALEEPLRKAELQVKSLQERLFEAEASVQRESKAATDTGFQIKSLQIQGVSLAQAKVQLEDQLEKLTDRHELVVSELNRLQTIAAQRESEAAQRENEVETQRAEAAVRESALEARLKQQQESFEMAKAAQSERGEENVEMLAWYREELGKAQEALEHRSRLVQSLEAEVRSMHTRTATIMEEQGLSEQFRSKAVEPAIPAVKEEEQETANSLLNDLAQSPTPSTQDLVPIKRSPERHQPRLSMTPPSSSSRPVSLSLSPPQDHFPPLPAPSMITSVPTISSPTALVGPAIAPMSVPVLKPTFPSSAQLSLFASKPTYSGQLRDGWPHGRGLTTWADGRVYEGEWCKGVFTGTGTCVWSNGDVYEGEWEDGFAHGLGAYTYATGAKYEGTFQQDKFHGHGAYCDVSGWKYRGGWEQGKMHGWGLVVTRSGEKLRQHFFRGVPAGSPEASDQLYSQMLMAVSEVVNTVREQTKGIQHSAEVEKRIHAASDRRPDTSTFSTPFSSPAATPAGTVQQPHLAPPSQSGLMALRSPSGQDVPRSSSAAPPPVVWDTSGPHPAGLRDTSPSTSTWTGEVEA